MRDRSAERRRSPGPGREAEGERARIGIAVIRTDVVGRTEAPGMGLRSPGIPHSGSPDAPHKIR